MAFLLIFESLGIIKIDLDADEFLHKTRTNFLPLPTQAYMGHSHDDMYLDVNQIVSSYTPIYSNIFQYFT